MTNTTKFWRFAVNYAPILTQPVRPVVMTNCVYGVKTATLEVLRRNDGVTKVSGKR